jgi:hypothetical protein
LDPRQTAADAIRAVDLKWSPNVERIEFADGRAWRPDLRHSNGHLLHVAFDEIDEPWAGRLRAAAERDLPLTLALAPAALTLENLGLAQAVGATLLVLKEDDGDTISVAAYPSVAELVVREDLALDGGGLKALGEPLLESALAETDSYRKGLLFEHVLCLMFSQVSYVAVREHRYRNETEEVDVVLDNRATGHISDLFNGAIVLVSGKNQRAATGAPAVRELRGNMSKRRRRCNFGILCAAGRIAEQAEIERGAATDEPEKAIALLSGGMIRGLLASTQIDRDLEIELRKAVLPPHRGAMDS